MEFGVGRVEERMVSGTQKDCLSQYPGLNEYCGWYPCPDSNRGLRFRKPLLYPPELQGHVVCTAAYELRGVDGMTGRLALLRCRSTRWRDELGADATIVACARRGLGALPIDVTSDVRP